MKKTLLLFLIGLPFIGSVAFKSVIAADNELSSSLPTLLIEVSPEQKSNFEYGKEEFYTANGKAVALDSFIGKPVIVFMYKKSCANCRVMLKGLDNFKQENPDVMVVPIMFANPTLSDARAIFAEEDVRYLPMYLDKSGLFYSKAGVKVSPLTILINRQGKEVDRIMGQFAWRGSMLQAKLAKIKAM